MTTFNAEGGLLKRGDEVGGCTQAFSLRHNLFINLHGLFLILLRRINSITFLNFVGIFFAVFIVVRALSFLFYLNLVLVCDRHVKVIVLCVP